MRKIINRRSSNLGLNLYEQSWVFDDMLLELVLVQDACLSSVGISNSYSASTGRRPSKTFHAKLVSFIVMTIRACNFKHFEARLVPGA